MYRYMSETLKSLSDGSLREKCRAMPEKISCLLSDYNDEAMENQVTQLVMHYIQQRNYSSSIMDQENFFDWQRKYLLCEREKLFLDKKNPSKVAILDAALIYKLCFELEVKDASSRACEFAWGVCSNEYFEIFAGENKIYVASDAQYFALK